MRLAYNEMPNNMGIRNSKQFDSDSLYPYKFPWCALAFTKSINSGIKYLVTINIYIWKLVTFACLL